MAQTIAIVDSLTQTTCAAAFGDRLLLTEAGSALAIANLRYWSRVAPLVKAQILRWEERAHQITDVSLHELAANKLRDERFNAEVAATLATLSPANRRPAVIKALVAYEILYDYLDGLTELPSLAPIRDGQQLYRALSDALVAPPQAETNDYFHYFLTSDGGYLEELVSTVRESLTSLPSYRCIVPLALRAAGRCAEAQTRAHAVSHLGTAQLEQWAKRETDKWRFPLGWRGFLAGAASSILTVHALITIAAAQSVSCREAASLDSLYLSTAVLSTLLDGLVDYEADQHAGRHSYLRYYPDTDLLAEDLAGAAREAIAISRSLRCGPHHAMTTVGVVAYYLSAPGGKSNYAHRATIRLQEELSPLLTPTLAVMRAWRAAKRIAVAQRHRTQAF